MKKTELIKRVAARGELTKADAAAALEVVLGGIAKSLKPGEEVRLAGFGTVSKKEQFNLRFQRAGGQLQDTARVRAVRRDLARIKTIAAQKRAEMKEGRDDAADILARVRSWAGGERQALAWYRAQPIAAFGDRTPESLVKSGQAAALRDYLDHIALGGFA